uniref:Mitogen-activated protein kinase n=1 Tax=Rhodosorus marinus TaxID=101924 RepID=A0A7S2ZSA4_9RHOD|mmetsp:Transcript_30911/g.118478  ORF Transcript_30911/g.118478 Transcript_30911/m.118478 type:complete len:454 (+) Transcript_30911:518-1879(+)|eukprot:CAMPEP_0113961724 /NCGR_PEP_ID=MMETSP0011_2-20120614/5487_1 /TAXON_ID=101924 /ORGANISM="Rhodosorus marinus" /LENGTH=453 /DNA_ID=CAMNT_0000973435 /DNA_START=411 /DNA_END=1772 /DNA_ORIENTATION=- /assembly_acc=CAM_ASM_000156
MSGGPAGATEDPLDRLKNTFFVPLVRRNRYTIQQVVGEGAYGVVVSAIDNVTGDTVAVKRIMRLFEHMSEATRILREIKFLRVLNRHENVISIRDVLLPDDRDKFDDVFVVFDYMPADLNRLLRSDIPLSPEHIRWMMYQLTRALHFLDALHVYHRDLKPSNILINADCDLRICDFGLARASFHGKIETAFWTDYVATRWYRAPELIMSYTANYSTAIDMWSLGCIFAEMLNHGRPLFPGRNAFHQMQLIREALGTPDPAALKNIPHTKTKQFFMSLPRKDPPGLHLLFPEASQAAVNFLGRLLQQDPERRPTAEEALLDPYFEGLYEQADSAVPDPIPQHEFDFERKKLTVAELRALFYEEILLYHPEIRAQRRQDPNALRYDVSSQADNFRGQFRQMKDGIAEDNFVSEPRQRLGNLWERTKSIEANQEAMESLVREVDMATEKDDDKMIR